MQRLDTGFSYHSRKTASGNRRLVAATVIVVILIILDVVTGGFVRSVVRATVSGLSSAFHATGERIVTSGFFSSRSALAHQNADLAARIAALEEEVALSSALQSQISALSEIDHVVSAAPGITAPVVSSAVASPYGTFLIGAGSADGVAIGSAVLSPQGSVVGTVTDTSTHTATVLEIFTTGRTTDALLDGVSLTVKGTGGGNATTLVPHGVAVASGDAVLAPSLGQYPIGIVGHVDADPSSAAMQVYIGSPANLDSLQYVVVVPSIKTPVSAHK